MNDWIVILLIFAALCASFARFALKTACEKTSFNLSETPHRKDPGTRNNHPSFLTYDLNVSRLTPLLPPSRCANYSTENKAVTRLLVDEKRFV